MNDYWHIPRASLASSSSAASSAASNRSHKSHSNSPTSAQRSASQNPTTATTKAAAKQPPSSRRALPAVHGAGGSRNGGGSGSNTRRNSELSATSAAATAAAAAAVLAAAAAAPKRGSRSSQGSTDSNNSTRSVASGSLLLTAANLERFAEIHRRQDTQHKLYLHNNLSATDNGATATAYNANLMQALASKTNASGDAIITLDPNLDFVRGKDMDTVSIASSMHFTMVNGGDDGPSKRPKRGLCDRGRQVTVLIISMSTIFLLLIMGMVYALEMRAREMPQS